MKWLPKDLTLRQKATGYLVSDVVHELHWLIWTCIQRTTAAFKRRRAPDSAMRRSPLFLRRVLLLERRTKLRHMLREHPRWKLGHCRLGLTELKLEILNDGPRDQRALGSIRTSAEAVKVLSLSGQSAEREKGRALLEADYLLAMLEFLKKNPVAAFAAFEQLLLPEHSVQLTEEVYWSVLEYAAAAAMVVGKAEEAKVLLLRIPKRARSGEQQSALRYLDLPAE